MMIGIGVWEQCKRKRTVVPSGGTISDYWSNNGINKRFARLAETVAILSIDRQTNEIIIILGTIERVQR